MLSASKFLSVIFQYYIGDEDLTPFFYSVSDGKDWFDPTTAIWSI